MKRSDVKKVQLSITCIVLLTVLIFLINIPVDKYKDKGLKSDIEQFLRTVDLDYYTIEEAIYLNSTLEALGNYYRLQNNQTIENVNTYICVIRIMGLSGPVPAVYIFDKMNGARFIGSAGVATSQENEHGLSKIQISHWENVLEQAFSNDSDIGANL